MGVYEEKSWNKHGSKEKKAKKSRQIPAFGNWDYENDLPITQYFESARQAGLIRSSRFSSATVSDSQDWHTQAHSQDQCHNIYTLQLHKCSNYSRAPPLPKPKISQEKEYRRPTLKKINIDYYVTEPAKQQCKFINKNNNIRGQEGAMCMPTGKEKQNTKIENVKAVDEDLYKISPQLLHSSKRNKRLGLFSRCLVPSCMV